MSEGILDNRFLKISIVFLTFSMALIVAILSADAKGYSVLMADEEIHTIETLKTYRRVISDLVSEHSGRVVDSPGDNILAEFRSSVDAVDCAVKIQKKLDKKNSKT